MRRLTPPLHACPHRARTAGGAGRRPAAASVDPERALEKRRGGARGRRGGGVAGGAIRLVELRARVPRYQRDMLRYLAGRDATSVNAVLVRELEDVTCAHAEELAAAVPGVAEALAWPESGGGRGLRMED